MRDSLTLLVLLIPAFTILPADADTLIIEPPVMETNTGIEIQDVYNSTTGEYVGEAVTYGTDPSNTYTEIYTQGDSE